MIAVLLACFAAAGCGRSSPPSGEADLRFESLDADTAELARGEPLLTEFRPYRDRDGALRARGRTRLPEGTRLQLSVHRPGSAAFLARSQFSVARGGFDTPPLRGPDGVLPEGLYRFELLAYFDPGLQPPEVMAATGNGRALRGPGVVRGNAGVPAFVHTEDRRI